MGMTERVQFTLEKTGAVLLGTRLGDVSRFSSIRYAHPPIGHLRFTPPQALPPMGTLDARHPGPVAPQSRSLLADALGDIDAPQDEDCLYLTVWTPTSHASTDAGKPVLVWLHGGALQSGGGAIAWYDGAHLARMGDVVVVAVNYRLGALGWLCPSGGTGNLGLLDQALAMQWVVEHIGSLGGDHRRITVMGQSAGALCAVALLARQRHVQRMILQSAPLGRSIRTLSAANALGDAVLRAAGASDLDAARSLPVQRLLEAQQAPQVREVLRTLQDGLGLYSLVADGATLPTALDLSELAGVTDVLIGTNRDEMAAFPGYGRRPESQQVADAVFDQPASQWACAAEAAGRKAWRYRFDAAPNTQFGACHCIELPFVFDSWQAFTNAPMLAGLKEADATRLSREVQQAWLAFVCQGAAPWPRSPHVHHFT